MGAFFPSVAELCENIGRVNSHRWIGREAAEKLPEWERCVQLLSGLARPGAVAGSQEGFHNVLDCILNLNAIQKRNVP